MVEKVIWSIVAEDDLEGVYLYFEDVNPKYAVMLVDKIFERIELLRAFPESGNMVKEMNVSFIREVFVDNFKVCYSYINGNINILRIKHKGNTYGKL